MKLSDFLSFTDKITESVSEAIERINSKLSSRIDGIEGQVKGVSEKVNGLATADELDAVRAALNASAESFTSQIEVRVKEMKTGTTVVPGVKSISMDGNTLVIENVDGDTQEIEIPVVAGPAGASGMDGKDGSDGKDGLPGKDGQDGRDGVDGKDGLSGESGKDGVSIVGAKMIDGGKKFSLVDSEGNQIELDMPEPIRPDPPRDPIDVKDALIGRENNLVLTFSDGSTKDLGRVVGRDGIDGINGRDGIDGASGPEGPRGLPGIDGRDGVDGINGRDGVDGLGFDDMSVDLLEDKRTVNFKFSRGDIVKEYKLRFPVMIFRGGYNPEAIYEEGDTVQFMGSSYHASRETIGEAPGTDGSPWVIATSAGRSIRGERGLPGADGRNGTNGRDFRPLS